MTRLIKKKGNLYILCENNNSYYVQKGNTMLCTYKKEKNFLMLGLYWKNYKRSVKYFIKNYTKITLNDFENKNKVLMNEELM